MATEDVCPRCGGPVREIFQRSGAIGGPQRPPTLVGWECLDDACELSDRRRWYMGVKPVPPA